MYAFFLKLRMFLNVTSYQQKFTSKNKLKDTSFTFPVTNVTILSIFRTHAQEEYCKVLEMNSTSILYSLAFLLFENTSKVFSQSLV